MPILAALLVWAGRYLLFNVVLRMFVAAGLGFATYKLGVQPLIDFARSSAGGLGQLAAWLGFLRLDQGLSLVASALVTRTAYLASRAALAKIK